MQCVILHGAFGSKNGNWFPWLKKKLEAMNHEVFLEQYPVDNWDDIKKESVNTTQNLTSWMSFFEKNILPKLNKKGEIIFYGHSLSPVFVLHLVGKFNLQLKGAIFASPFLESLHQEKTWQFDVVNNTFYKTDFDWIKLKTLIPRSYVLYGTNDPYVPNRFPIDFAKRLGSEIVPIENGLHLGDNFKEFPILLDLTNKLLE